MAKPGSPPPGWHPAGQMAQLLVLSLERLRQLAKEGHIPRAVKGNYPLVATVQGYVRFLKAEERRTTLVEGDRDLKKARQREIEIRIAREEGHLVDFEDVQAVFSVVMGELRSELLGVPAAVTRDPKLRTAIKTAHEQAFGRASKKFGAHAAALRAGRDPFVITK